MIPFGWIEKQLGEIGVVGAGNSAPQGDENFTGGVYPFFRTADVGRVHFGIINNSVDLLNEKGKTGLKLFKKGTILFPKSGASTFLNHRVMMDVDGFVVSHLATITPNENIISGKYLLYYLSTIDSKTLIQDQNYPSLNLPIISSINVKFPEDIEEQQRIVEKLDTLFADIEKEKQIAQQNLQNAKELFESELNKIVIKNDKNWTKKKLNDVCVVERGSSPRPIKNFVTTDENGVNWIRIGDCSEKYVNSTSQKITPDGAKKSRFVNVGDFIISNSMSYGKPYILNINGCIHDGWFVLRLDKTLVDTDYFYYLLSSPFVKEQYDSLATGAIVQNISSDLIKKVQFCLPPLSEQQTIVQQINVLHKQTQELEQIYTQQIADLDELKQAILKKVFNGEL